MIGEISFYQRPEKNYRTNYRPGQLFLAPIQYVTANRVQVARLDYFDPEKPNNSNYTFEKLDLASQKPVPFPTNNPLSLKPDEFAMIVKAKFRPVIVVSPRIPFWQDFDKCLYNIYLAIPLYSTEEGGVPKFSSFFMLHVQAYQYPTLFYLPNDDEHQVCESIARLDRLSVIHENLLSPIPVSLTDDALECLTNWLHHFLGADLDLILQVFRAEAMEKYGIVPG